MSKRRDKDRAVPPPTALPARDEGPGLEWLTQWAFYGALALVLARATMGDFSKSRNEPVTADTPRAAGAATSLAIDLLCCLPAVLVLSRRVMDRQYVLRWAWSVLPLGLLAGWGVLSTTWAADRFAALSAAFHWMGAFAMLWAAAQLVRSWLRLRVVAALMVGLLLAYFTYSLFYRTVDLPDLKRNWEKNKTQILAERGIADDPFLSKQFENRIMSGELYGVFTSPNTMGAMVVLLLVIALGVAAQRALDDPSDRTWIALLAVVPLAGWMLVCTKSRTTLVTPLLAAGMVAAAWRWRGWLGARTKGAYWAGVGVVLLGTAAVVGHGLYHHGLVHPSLTFRWHYWVGGMRLFAQHPLAGVGLDNFGPYYLGVRLPEAAEEVKDPHNLFVKFLTELGLIGGALCLAWLGRLAWELTRPVVPPTGNAPVTHATGPRGGAGAIRGIAVMALGGFLVNVIASVDFGADKVFVVNEVLRRFGMFALLLIGASVAAMRSLKEPELEWRPAPLVLYAMLAGLAVFVVHNLIDFSLFEPGVTTLFAFVAGAALGVRQPSVAGRRRRTAVAAVVLGVTVVTWLIVGGFVWTSFAVAEDAAYAGALALHDRRAGEAMRQFDQARLHVPLNADYALRAAQALIAENPQFSQGAMDRLALAIATNPMAVDAYLTRARYLLHSSNPAAYRDQIKRDFARAVELNPNEVSIRVEYGDALRTLGTPEDRAEAVRQYAEAVRYNSLLKVDEPKRLRGERLADVERKAADR